MKVQIRRGMAAIAAAAALFTGSIVSAATVAIDFGSGGNTTPSTIPQPTNPANTNYRVNNVSNASNATLLAAGALAATNMVDTTGVATGISIASTSATWQVNPLGPTGLQASRIGDFAYDSGTVDWAYLNAGTTGTFQLSGLTPGAAYSFAIFASRDAGDTRTSQYVATGVNTVSALLTTTGTGIGTNASNVAVNYNTGINPAVANTGIANLNNVIANATGNITLTVGGTNLGGTNSFQYLGQMNITTPIPEPTSLGLLGLGGVALLRRRR